MSAVKMTILRLGGHFGSTKIITKVCLKPWSTLTQSFRYLDNFASKSFDNNDDDDENNKGR